MKKQNFRRTCGISDMKLHSMCTLGNFNLDFCSSILNVFCILWDRTNKLAKSGASTRTAYPQYMISLHPFAVAVRCHRNWRKTTEK